MEITLRAPTLMPPPSAHPLVSAEVLALHDELVAYHRAWYWPGLWVSGG